MHEFRITMPGLANGSCTTVLHGACPHSFSRDSFCCPLARLRRLPSTRYYLGTLLLQARCCDAQCVHDALISRICIKINRRRTGLRIGPRGPETTLLRCILKMPRKSGVSGPGGPIPKPVRSRFLIYKKSATLTHHERISHHNAGLG